MKGGNGMITFEEINEQPDKFLTVKKRFLSLVKSPLELFKNGFSEINFVGCGTSYNLAMGLSMQFNRICSDKEIRSNFYSGSEIAFGLKSMNEKAVVVGISRSGESTETVLAMKRCKEEGLKTIAITCEAESSLTKICDASVVLDFIKEESVVMTQSFSAMAFVGSALIRQILKPDKLKTYLEIIPKVAETVLIESRKLVRNLKMESYDHFVFLGYDEYYAASLEGVTKVMETSLCEVDAFQTLEYRHGPKSKVDEKTLACILSNSVLHDEEKEVALEIEKLGGKSVNISNEKMEDLFNVNVPYDLNDFGDWFVRVIPMQFIGVEKAVSEGLNPDNPKNLNKVVKL